MRHRSAAFLASLPLLHHTPLPPNHQSPLRPPSASTRPPTPPPTPAVAAALAIASSLLGPSLDSYHSAFGTLTYTHPLHLGPLTTAPWVPPLFAFAGLAIGIPALLIDALSPPPSPRPPPPKTLVTIAAFAAIYYLSAALDAAAVPSRGPVLLAAALTEWALLDASLAAAAMGLAAAAAGAGAEAALINLAHAYTYARPDIAGIPLWIAPVYFAGGPAVASLARSLAAAAEGGGGGVVEEE